MDKGLYFLIWFIGCICVIMGTLALPIEQGALASFIFGIFMILSAEIYSLKKVIK